ncbi:hypothetical protein [Enterococcus larvae]|uniref:hypothetical protein n=1 Tax=Enterococcus larvae TaxID=2794352 RepID=UPI003F3E1C62
MVKKFFGYIGNKRFNIYEALKYRDTNSLNNGEKLIFFDGTTKIKQKMTPKRGSKNGRRPHFAYYPNSSHDGIGKDMTVTHKAYQEGISELKKFCIETPEGEAVIVEVEKSELEYYINDGNRYYLIDIFLKLKSTYPFYYFYKWKGTLAIEIWVSHKTELKKIGALRRKGVPAIECKITKKLSLNENIQNYSEYMNNVQKVINRYSNVNFHLYGKFISNAIHDDITEWSEKYLEFKNYHEEKRRMEIHLDKLKLKIEELGEVNKSLTNENLIIDAEIRNKKSIITDVNDKIKKIETNRSEIESYDYRTKKLEEENAALISKLEELQNYKDHPIKSTLKAKFGFK